MMCYRDMTFCTFYKECGKGETCCRAFTEEQSTKADQWWGWNGEGESGAPVAFFCEQPDCFKKVLDK